MIDPANIEIMLTQLNHLRRNEGAMRSAIRQTIGNLVDEAEALREAIGDKWPRILKDSDAASDWRDKLDSEGL